MTEVGVYEAKTHLSRLLRRVEDGEEVVISRGGKPIARIVAAVPRRREFGMDEGVFEVPDDFDEPDEELIALFNDGPIFPPAPPRR